MAHQQNKPLIDALYNCAAECNHCASACLDEQDVKMMTTCIKLDRDCADICTLVASFLARGSQHGYHLLKECAEICGLCATECEKHAHHADHCKSCAASCRACEAACKAA